MADRALPPSVGRRLLSPAHSEDLFGCSGFRPSPNPVNQFLGNLSASPFQVSGYRACEHTPRENRRASRDNIDRFPPDLVLPPLVMGATVASEGVFLPPVFGKHGANPAQGFSVFGHFEDIHGGEVLDRIGRWIAQRGE